MLKHVSLIEAQVNGQHSWRLLDSNGRPFPAFGLFAKTLERRPANTRRSYCRSLAEFFDYLFEAAASFAIENTESINQDTLVDILEAYDDYLVFGGDSGNAIAQVVDHAMPSPRVSRRSSAAKHAAIRRFLQLSERIRAQMVELTTAGHQSLHPSDATLIAGLGERRPPTAYERQSMIATSMLAGVIAKGPQLIAERVLPTSAPDLTYQHERAFPFDKVGNVLKYLATYRDRALYAFCAASGCRVSEALQLLWDDIDTSTQTVRLIDPKSRPHHPSYLALRPIERDKLVWKGRATSLTLLIDPFATMFFEALAGYLRYEYVPHGRHKFVFQYAQNGEAGRPYFLAASSSRNGVLGRAMLLAGISGVSGPHSFRHMYGTYLLNYFPRPDGTYGLPLAIVQKLMGHQQAKDTAKYARHDRDLIEAELRYARMMLYGNGTAKSLNELKREALQAKLEEIERRLADEAARQLDGVQ